MKIGLLFKSEVGLIDSEYTAGAERMFLQDIEIFEEEGVPYKAFCAGKFIKRKSFKGKVEKLYYPRFFRKLIRGARLRLPFKIVFRLSYYSLVILDLFYAFLFVLKSRDCNIWYAYQVPVLALLYPKKTVIAFQNFNRLPFYNKFKKRYLQSRFYFCSKYLQNKYFKTHKNLENIRSRVIYNAANFKKFSPGRKKKKQEGKGLNFLYISTWRKEKGIFLLLDAIRILEKRGLTKNRFLIAASPDLWYSDIKDTEKVIKKKVKEISANLTTVYFLGKVGHSQLKYVYRNADCLVFPSIWGEPFSVAVIEALSCGLPVIAFDVGGNPEILKDKKTGFILKEKSADALANKIQEISSNPRVLRNTRKNCLDVAKKFSRELRRKTLLKLLIEQS